MTKDEIKFNILLIEDEEDYALLIQDYLTFKNFSVTARSNGDDIIFFLTKNTPFHGVIIDHSLQGGMDGILVSKLIRKEYPDLHIFLHTAHDNFSAPGIESKIKSIPNTTYITKGSITKLYNIVNNTLLNYVEE